MSSIGQEYVEIYPRPNGDTGVLNEHITDNFYERIHYEDQHAEERRSNLFWPFSCFIEWEVAQFLESIGISQEKKDEFFHLKYV
jgi:hypothetical protein